METLAQTIERKRKEVIAKQNQQGIGTLQGLAEVIRKRKQATMQPIMPQQESSNAKQRSY